MALPTREDFLAQLAPDSTLAQYQDDCPICYEIVSNATQTSCGHIFCLECLEPWSKTSHTCPKCRRELYEKPEDEDTPPVVDFDWPQFDFDFNEVGVRELLQHHLDGSFLDASPPCPMHMIAYVEYDVLLTIAVAYILNRVRDEEHMPDHPAYLPLWTTVASTIESVLSRLRDQSIEGRLLFLAMDFEIQREFRLPEHSAMWERRGEDYTFPILEFCIEGVLRRIVEAGYHCNPEPPSDDQQATLETGPDYSMIPFCLDSQAFPIACLKLPPLDTPLVPLDDGFLSRQIYVSRPLLISTYLASIHRLMTTQTIRFCQDNYSILHEMYSHLQSNLPRTACAALGGHHGELTTVNDLLASLLQVHVRLGLKSLAQSYDGPFSEESVTDVLGHFAGQLGRALLPVGLAAAELHDDLQSMRVLPQENADGVSSTE